MTLEWSADALADLDRFAEFLQSQHPLLASMIADAIIERTRVLEQHPELGHPIADHEHYRQLVLQVMNAAYVFQYHTKSNGFSLEKTFTAFSMQDTPPSIRISDSLSVRKSKKCSITAMSIDDCTAMFFIYRLASPIGRLLNFCGGTMKVDFLVRHMTHVNSGEE
jgi:plasmid stabilization system protein ParE